MRGWVKRYRGRGVISNHVVVGGWEGEGEVEKLVGAEARASGR